MTVHEWIYDKFNLLGFSCPESVALALSNGLDLEYEADEVTIEQIEINLFHYIPYMMAAPQTISESGFSVTRQKLGGLYKFLYNKYKDKLEDTQGVLDSIEDKTDVW